VPTDNEIKPAKQKSPKAEQFQQVIEVGEWLFTCRAQFEGMLFNELKIAKCKPKPLGAAFVSAQEFPKTDPVFCRMAFQVTSIVHTYAEVLAALPKFKTCVQVWTPDSDEGNKRSSLAHQWQQDIHAARPTDFQSPWKSFEAGHTLTQVCLFPDGTAVVGHILAREAMSLAAGGKTRMKRTESAPSRAAMKLDEALDWHRMEPGKGEVCVDLGSAPGGWTRRLIERGSKVLSVDTGQLDADLMQHKKVQHFTMSSFDFVPPHPVDWVFCDMAWRPLEVAQLLGKWARNAWAMHLVANFKLPMKDKLPAVARIKTTLQDNGWMNLKVRQLYHDRDEITVVAVRRAK
jgi:23S rRNA (cytidine2498-2'-O)-methyltransferase